jgi:tetratricopeptide (TPR) repeat protein
VIEIGVERGFSMKLWPRFFTRATIIGVDIHEVCRQYASDRVIIEIGSQSDLGFITRLCQKYQPKIVIDDGSHLARDVLFTFQNMFPSLLPGGIYVMEDLYHNYGELAKIFNQGAEVLPSDYIFDIGHTMLASPPRAASAEPAEQFGLKKYLFDHIDSIEIIRKTIIIRKKQEDDKARMHAEWLALVEQTDHLDNWIMLYQKLLRDNGSPELAATVLRRCIAFEPDNLHFHYYLAEVLDRMGHLPEAIAEARRAVELSKRQDNVLAAKGRLDALTAKAKLRG